MAYITPVFKKGDATQVCNYRPISLTCTLCKLMESVIKDHLLSRLVSKGLINKHQHGFISKHSTITNLLECTYDWSLAFHGKPPVDVIYIDFSKLSRLTAWYTLNSYINYKYLVSTDFF